MDPLPPSYKGMPGRRHITLFLMLGYYIEIVKSFDYAILF